MKYKNISFLLLFFIIFGCRTVEKVEKQPVPPVKKPEKPTVVRFYVEPSKFYNDEYGYIGVGHQTKEEKIEKMKELLVKNNLSQEDYKKKLNAVPKGGIISVHIGRKDLNHANTQWYSFSGYKDNKNIFMINGKEGIPNVKGRDENWWNIVEIPLNEDIDSVITVIVKDKKINREFSFKILQE